MATTGTSINCNLITIILSCTLDILVDCDHNPESGMPPADLSLAAYYGDVAALVYLAKEKGLFEKKRPTCRFEGF